MSMLRSLETSISNLVEGTFGRLFRSEVRPIELAHKLAREMDEHRTTSVSRTYAPNEYSIWLSPSDRARYEGVEDELIEELCAYLLEHARRESLILASQPSISFHTDDSLALGEFGIRARLVRPEGDHDQDGRPAPSPAAGQPPPAASSAVREPEPEPEDEHGRTMIYSNSARVRGVGGDPIQEQPARRPPRALLTVAGRRLLVPLEGGVIGRSRDCEIVLDDAGISRRHAELRPSGEGWRVADLGSTNGLRVNGREVRVARSLNPGDRLQLGSTEIVFDLS
jgi:predicted component of type VI protein secretion system